MSDIKNAAEAAQNLAKQYKGVLDLVKALNEVGDLENYKASLDAQLAASKAVAEKANYEAEVASHKLADLLNSYTETKKTWEEEYAAHVASVEKTKTTASSIAAEIVEVAQQQAREAVKTANERVADTQDILDTLTAKIEEKQKQFDALNKSISAVLNKFQ